MCRWQLLNLNLGSGLRYSRSVKVFNLYNETVIAITGAIRKTFFQLFQEFYLEWLKSRLGLNPAGNYKFKVNYRSSRTRRKMCSKLTIKTANGVVLVSLLLTLNIFHTCSSVFIVNFEQVNAGRELFTNTFNYENFVKCKGLFIRGELVR